MLSDLRKAAENTPPQRDRYIDLLRAVAITVVVLGHWLVVAVTYGEADGLSGFSALVAVPWSHPLTWLFQVMPLFFLVGGYANGASLLTHRRSGGDVAGWLITRSARLLGPTTVFLVTLTASALLARLLGTDPPLVGTAVWLASIPLWFLTAYVAVVVLTPVLYPLHQRVGMIVPVVLVTAVAAADAARFLLGLPYAAANYLLVWLAVYQVGFVWRDGRLTDRRRPAQVVTAGGLLALVLLTAVGPYPVSMVAVPGEPVQNTAPPTLALLALAATQIGLALLLRRRADRWLGRRRPWFMVVAVNSVVLTVFLWHMAALVLAAVALYPPGLMAQPPVGSADWFLWRLPWLACLLLMLTVLVAVFGRAERRGRRPDGDAVHRDIHQGGKLARLVLTYAGLAMVLVGLFGITTAGRADHGPLGLPGEALLAYLLGTVILWLIPLRRSRRPLPS
ncbi:acyltransferase family protein [Streptomyces sp. NPDC059866]|uniref:acyltransferase family protein n=1 Tax=Streptomyces sp. NPDC059866 TaxID=3346978 RepID=UPI003650EA8B